MHTKCAHTQNYYRNKKGETTEMKRKKKMKEFRNALVDTHAHRKWKTNEVNSKHE